MRGLPERGVDWLATACCGLAGFRKLASAGALRKAVLLNGETRMLPRQLARLLWEVRDNENLRNECLSAKKLYHGGDFIDAGAHAGLYSAALAPFARAGARLVSIEPDPSAYPVLVENLGALSRQFPTLVFPVLPLAAGDGRKALMTSPNEWHRSYQPSDTFTKGEPTFPSLTVDQVVDTLQLVPDFIKVDVEGAEFAVLSGAKTTLQRFDCRLMLEIHPRWQPPEVSPDACKSLLAQIGFRGELIEENDVVQRWIFSK